MINFWSYKREYKKIKSKILIKIDKTISKGKVNILENGQN